MVLTYPIPPHEVKTAVNKSVDIFHHFPHFKMYHIFLCVKIHLYMFIYIFINIYKCM